MISMWDSMTTSVCTHIEMSVVLIYQYCEGKLSSSKYVSLFSCLYDYVRSPKDKKMQDSHAIIAFEFTLVTS